MSFPTSGGALALAGRYARQQDKGREWCRVLPAGLASLFILRLIGDTESYDILARRLFYLPLPFLRSRERCAEGWAPWTSGTPGYEPLFAVFVEQWL